MEQLLRAMRSIAEIADAALRDDHRLLYFAQLARHAEGSAMALPKAGEPRNGESRNDAKAMPATTTVAP